VTIMDTILVVNSGSSSLKFQLFDIAGPSALKRLIKGQVDGIGNEPRLRVKGADEATLIDRTYAPEAVGNVSAAIGIAASWLKETQNLAPVAVGHRVVHGGPNYDRPVLVDDRVLADLARLTSLAPLHQPHNLAPIGALLARFPKLPQVACFDTAFHRGHDPIVDHYAIPERFYAQGIRRYGFHGLSYEYVAERLREVAPDAAKGRVVIAHLGSGASLCAVREGRSIDSTLGFTALDGLPMGTRPGQLDPGVVLHLLGGEGMTVAEVQSLLYRECGLKGLSGSSNDVRALEASSDPSAALALDHFVYRVGLHAGMMAAALDGLDAFVFTAGIGENSVKLRARITERLAWLGAVLDPVANAAHRKEISSRDSRIGLYVIPTDEELMIARHTVDVLRRSHDS
jgi:acetate kinase